jgi:hypothetical protein
MVANDDRTHAPHSYRGGHNHTRGLAVARCEALETQSISAADGRAAQQSTRVVALAMKWIIVFVQLMHVLGGQNGIAGDVGLHSNIMSVPYATKERCEEVRLSVISDFVKQRRAMASETGRMLTADAAYICLGYPTE